MPDTKKINCMITVLVYQIVKGKHVTFLLPLAHDREASSDAIILLVCPKAYTSSDTLSVSSIELMEHVSNYMYIR